MEIASYYEVLRKYSLKDTTIEQLYVLVESNEWVLDQIPQFIEYPDLLDAVRILSGSGNITLQGSNGKVIITHKEELLGCILRLIDDRVNWYESNEINGHPESNKWKSWYAWKDSEGAFIFDQDKTKLNSTIEELTECAESCKAVYSVLCGNKSNNENTMNVFIGYLANKICSILDGNQESFRSKSKKYSLIYDLLGLYHVSLTPKLKVKEDDEKDDKIGYCLTRYNKLPESKKKMIENHLKWFSAPMIFAITHNLAKGNP